MIAILRARRPKRVEVRELFDVAGPSDWMPKEEREPVYCEHPHMVSAYRKLQRRNYYWMGAALSWFALFVIAAFL